MSKPKFVYVIYIRTTPEKLWEALTRPEFMKVYWWGAWRDCEMRVGARWKLIYSDGTVCDTGEVLDMDPPRRLVLAWQNEFKPELKAEGVSRATFVIEPAGATVKLTVTHEIGLDRSKFIDAVSGGWPMVLASLKTFLETGAPLPDPRKPT